jgi:predicted flap endonuclease-1-like 5' DNA nuclease
MRRFRLITVGLALLFGFWLVWRQVAQRRRTIGRNNYAPRSPLPEWSAAPIPTPDPSVVTGTAERTHNQSDNLTQPPEPAAPVQERTDVGFGIDTTLQNEPTVETDTGNMAEADTPQPNDLLRIEGIGPKLSTIVVAAGITSFAELATAEVGRLEAILEEAGIHTANPSTWPEQAHLAAQGKWDELQELQDRIKNGRVEDR